MSRRLLYVVSHPIQYQAPLLRLIAAQDDIALKVLFERIPEGPSYDPGFARPVGWDVPLLGGYEHTLMAETDISGAIAESDVIWLHGWQSRRFRQILDLAARLDKPVLMRAENWDGAMPDGIGLRGWAKRLYLRRIFARCAGFLAIGSKNHDYYVRHGIVPERIFPVPYAVDNAFFEPAAVAKRADRVRAATDMGLDPHRPIVLFAAKLIARKRLDLLIDAMTKLPASVQLLVVGDGPLRAGMQALAPGARFVGFRNQTELPAIYALADVFVLPSDAEPWGLAINEAMASGTAIVASDQVGAAFDLVDETCGRVFAAGDADALAMALLEVLKHPADMGAAARQRIATWDFQADLRGLRAAIGAVTRAIP